MSPPGQAPTPPGLGRGVALLAAGRAVQLVLSFVMLAVVGRLIGPEAYGIFALAMVAVSIGDIVVGGGLTDSLVQRADVTSGHEDASFLCTLLSGMLLWVAGWALSGHAASLSGQPQVGALLPVLLLVLPIMGIGAVPLARLQRGLRFGAIAGIDSATAVTSAVLGIGLILAGHGLWSLVASELLRVTARSAALLAVARYRPGLSGRPRHLAELFRFNSGTLGVRALGVLDRMLPRVLIGALLGAQALGFYAIAWRLYEQMNALLIHPLNALAMPIAARAQANPQALQALLARAIRLSSAIAFPAYLGLATIAPTLVPLIVGPGWQPAVACMQIMLLLGLRAPMNAFNSGVLRGLGRPDLQALTLAIGTAMTLVLVPLAAPQGLIAVTLVVTARRFVTWPLGARQVQRLTGFDWRGQAREAAPTLAAALIMVAAVTALQWALAGQLTALPLLLLAVSVGATTYALALALLAPSHLRDLRDRLLPPLRAALVRRKRFT